VTFAELIEKYIEEMALIGKPLGESHVSAMRLFTRMPIGKVRVVPFELKATDFIEHAKLRKRGFEEHRGVLPPTINQDLSYMRGPLSYAALGLSMPEITPKPITDAKPFLEKYNLIGKSRPRDRRPSDDEIAKMISVAQERNQHRKTKIPMDVLMDFAIFSGRRLGEICRLRWGDVNYEDRTCVVRDMKDPKQKRGNHHTFPLLGRAWDIVIERQAKRLAPDNPDERIFPYNAHSASQAARQIRKEAGIVGLRFHDNRREAASRAFEGRLNGRKYGVPEVMVITGHKNPQMLMRTYTKLNARDLHPNAAPQEALDTPPSSSAPTLPADAAPGLSNR
jgi:integrase